MATAAGRRSAGRLAAVRRGASVATPDIGRSRSRRSPSACRGGLGRRSPGARARPRGSSSRFARLRVRAAHRDERLRGAEAGGMAADRMARGRERADQVLARPPCPRTSPSTALVDLAKLRWRIERDYQELKQELGLGHYEGRGWRGFHHHATLCIAAYGFLISERETIPPSGPRAAAKLEKPALPARLSTPRRRRSGPSGTSRTRSPPCAGGSSSRSPGASTDVPAATRHEAKRPDPAFMTQ